MRGFFGGIVFGLILCGIGLVTLSLWSPLAPAPEVTHDAPQPAVPDEPEDGQPGVEAWRAEPEVTKAAPVSPVAGDPEPGDLRNIGRIDTAAPGRPGVAAPADEPATPPDPTPLPGNHAPIEPVEPTRPEITAPDAPAQDGEIGVDTTEPQNPVADHTLGFSGEQFNRGVGPSRASLDHVSKDAGFAASLPVRMVVIPYADNQPLTATLPLPKPEMPTETSLTAHSADDAPLNPGAGSKPFVGARPQPTAAPDLEMATVVSDQPTRPIPKIAPLPQAGVAIEPTGPTIGKRVVPLTERHRARPKRASDGEDGNTRAGNPTPLDRYAEAFENTDSKPLMSIILIDDGVATLPGILEQLPFPTTVALDPVTPDAAERMARYRAAGHEVLMLVRLPDFATARDVEVTLAAGFEILPETVGLLESLRHQSDRDLSAQLVAVASGTGRGLVAQSTGLNSTLRLAQRDGLPSAAVFRNLDRTGLDAATVLRGLDQAVFRAGQEGSVALVGRAGPDTIRILQGWARGNRASRVALVPVSAVLRRNGGAS